MNKYFGKHKVILLTNKETNEQIAVLSPPPNSSTKKETNPKIISTKNQSFKAANTLYSEFSSTKKQTKFLKNKEVFPPMEMSSPKA